MIAATVFSRDRPAQLDLLLRSLFCNAPWLKDVRVLYMPTDDEYEAGYALCSRYHGPVGFNREHGSFYEQTLETIRGDHMLLLCDDDVFYRPIPTKKLEPEWILDNKPEVLSVSLRLGQNCTQCYSLRKPQRVPYMPLNRWSWQDGEGDWGYTGSLDGDVWRTSQLRTLITANQPEWSNPNELEDHLHHGTRTSLLPHMACYPSSCVVGLPVNRVNTSHRTNRMGDFFPASLGALNARFLEGARLDLDAIDPAKVDSAHVEFPLTWMPKMASA